MANPNGNGDGPVRLGSSSRRLDVLAVAQGIEHECPLRPGLTVTILPAGPFNARFKRALQERVERMAERNGSAEEGADRFSDPAFVAQALVLTMTGLYGADGSEIPYTPELGNQILADPGNADVLAWIANESMRYEHYYTKDVEADAKNSSTGSSGKKAGVGRSAKTRS